MSMKLLRNGVIYIYIYMAFVYNGQIVMEGFMSMKLRPAWRRLVSPRRSRDDAGDSVQRKPQAFLQLLGFRISNTPPPDLSGSTLARRREIRDAISDLNDERFGLKLARRERRDGETLEMGWARWGTALVGEPEARNSSASH